MAKTTWSCHGSSAVLGLNHECPSIWFLRRLAVDHAPPGNALLLSFGALVLALVSGWLGGELVERLGVGVYEDADLNAPSSLSGAFLRQIPSWGIPPLPSG